MISSKAIKALAGALGLAFMAVPSSSPVLGEEATASQESQQVATQDPASAGETEREIKAFIGSYIKAFEGRDEPAIRALFVADKPIAWFTDGAKSYSSVDDVLAGMRRYVGITFKTALFEIEVVPLGPSFASVHSKFKTKLTIPGSEDFEYGGVITWIVENVPARGGWKVLEGHTSTPGGPPGRDDK